MSEDLGRIKKEALVTYGRYYPGICLRGLRKITKNRIHNSRCPEGRAVAQRLDAGFPPRRPGFTYGQHVGFVLDKAALGQVSSEYFGPIIPPISPLS
jgi:hypothetical protein